MSTLNEIAAQIGATIASVPDTGKVLTGNPSIGINSLETFVDQFVIPRPDDATRGQIRAWTIGYQGEDGEYRTMALGGAKKNREVAWLVRFFMSWDDTSEPVFRGLVEAVTLAIDANLSMGGTVMTHDACRVTTPNQGMGMVLGDYGCHAAEIRFRTLDEQTLATH